MHILDLASRTSSESNTSIQHSMPILQLQLDQWGPITTRNLALLDKSRDLYIIPVRTNTKAFSKLGRKIESYQWNSEENIIAAIQDAQLVVWYCPTASFNQKLLKLCSMHYESPELGRSPRINDFVGNTVSIRRADGSLINVPISPFPSLLHK